MHRAYFTLSVCIILLGLAHIAATPRYFPAFTSSSVWFASGGLAIILTGTLNLLRRIYGDAAPWLRRVCIATNVVMTIFALLAGYAGRASAIEFVLVLGLLGGATVLSGVSVAHRPAADQNSAA